MKWNPLFIAAVLAPAACATPPLPALVAPPPDPLPFWVESGPPLQSMYPERALRLEKVGAAQILCVVLADRHIDCTVRAEDPAGFGFGQAAVAWSKLVIVQPAAVDPRFKVGSKVIVPIRFVLP